MWKLGALIVAGTFIYCWVTDTWTTEKYTHWTTWVLVAGGWMLFAPVRDWIFHRPERQARKAVSGPYEPPRGGLGL